MSSSQFEILPTKLAMVLDEISKSNLDKKRGVVRVVTGISDVSFESLIEDFKLNGIEIESNLIASEGNFQLWSCMAARRLHILDNFLLAGNFYVLQNGFSIFIISGERRLFFRNIVLPITKIAFPNILIAYILTGEIFELLTNFSKNKKTPLRYNEFYYKKMFGEAFTVKKHEKRLKIEEYDLFNDAFLEAKENGGWLDRISVFGDKFKFTIARNGVIKYKNGTFSEYYQYFFGRIIELVGKRWKLFEHKSRSEQTELDVKPIIVEFESKVFEDNILKKQFLQELSRYPKSSYSVIHGGNPHLYVGIVDNLDNSSFSVRTYGTDALLISPQIRTTKAALVRFSTYILNNFQEGTIADFKV